MTYLYPCFAVAQRPCPKKSYQLHMEKVKEYLETVKDFDELISPQSLILHILGLEQSTKVRKNLEVVKKSKCFFPFLVGSTLRPRLDRAEGINGVTTYIKSRNHK